MSSNEKMTYDEFLHRLARRTGGDLGELDRFLHRIGPVMDGALRSDGELRLAGFGRFELVGVDTHSGTNPQTGATITIPAQAQVHFAPFQRLRLAVNWPYRRGRIQELPQEPVERQTSAVRWGTAVAILLIIAGIAVWLLWGRLSPPEHMVAAAPAGVAAAPVEAADNTSVEVPPIVSESVVGAATILTVVAGDNFWMLSARLWRSNALWPLLYVANRDRLPVADPDLLPNGIELRIPAPLNESTEATAEDRIRLQAAYRTVATDYRQRNNARAAAYERVAVRGARW